MGLLFDLVVELKNALRLILVTGLEASLHARDLVLEVVDALRTPDQTECLFHCFTHGYECETAGTGRVSEQWASDDRAGSRFWTGCQLGEESGETFPPTRAKTPINMGFYVEAEVGIGQNSPPLHGHNVLFH